MSSVHDSSYSWARLGVTLAIGSIGNVGMWAIILVMPAVQAEFGAGRAEASLPYAATMIGFAIGNFALGRAVDRYGAAVVQAAAGVVAAVAFVLAGFSPSVWSLSAMALVLGLGSSASFGPLIADVSHWFLRRRGLAVAVAASGNYLSGAIWPLALAGLLQDEGWRVVMFALAAISLVTVPPLCLFLRRQAPEAAHQAAAVEAQARAAETGLSPRALQILLCVAGVACCVAMSMPQVHIVAYCVDLGYGPAVGAEMLSMMLAAGVVSRIASGFLADWLGGVKTLLIGSGLQCAALLLYLPSDGLTTLYVVSLIFGLSQGGIVPSYAIIVREYMAPKEAGARVGTVIMSTIVGMALGGWMSGLIYDLTRSYEAAFLNGIAWNLVNIAIMVMLLRRTRAALPA